MVDTISCEEKTSLLDDLAESSDFSLAERRKKDMATPRRAGLRVFLSISRKIVRQATDYLYSHEFSAKTGTTDCDINLRC